MATRSTFAQLCAKLFRDRSGNFGIMAAVAVPVIIVAAGSAVDYTVANSDRTNLQQVADSAVLAGGAVFDGTNFAVAEAAAVHYIKGQVETATDEQNSDDKALTNKVKYKVSSSDKTLRVWMQKSVPTSLLKIANIDKVDVSVSASALSPMKPEKITFTPTKAQGWYFKKISVLVLRKGATTEELLGTVVYQPTTQTNGGQGTYVANPAGTIDLGKYTNLALRMDIKNDGCDIGYKATVKNSAVTCKKDNGASYKTYNTVLRTDDPNTSNHLFVDGKQVPIGVKASLEKYFGCSKKQEHAWEDGGGWDRQDFFYTVTATCGADGTFVRLVK
ncbi:TadE/TadG family type IV pilus assembly protein [Pararhizobium sp. O133]|uniref:TadE/TadG family type IV pilus assembly protein n=1 Tax=Pararhizobium sp. O133 TaxID=3449278 RepID=UPI003F682C68